MRAPSQPGAAPPAVAAALGVSIVIPTYRREQVLLDTLSALFEVIAPCDEILVVDQTHRHEADVQARLEALGAAGAIRWIRQEPPSIPAAMNRGLREARAEVVLFLDDDVRPERELVSAHRAAHVVRVADVIAGRVVQPWQRSATAAERAVLPFLGDEAGPRREFMGGNFSVRRDRALALGGFDENFVHVAYRFEAEFAHRLARAGGSIRYEPQASLDHLKAPAGGTRTYGEHQRTVRPSHAVGDYYFALRARSPGWWKVLLLRPWRSVMTRHHLRRPWWIPVTFVAELLGLAWAVGLFARGPRLLARPAAGAARG